MSRENLSTVCSDSEEEEKYINNNPLPQLPVEIILDVMSYLSLSDRKAAGLVCKDWYDASTVSRHIDKQVLKICRCSHDDNVEKIMNVLRHSHRRFYNFVFKEVELKTSWPIWDRYSADMKSLVLDCCSMSEKTLVEILKCCKNLHSLTINSCRECLMSGRLLEDSADIIEISSNSQSLKHLSLDSNRYLSDALFNRFVAIYPNLESLSLYDCQISFHLGLYKKFYPVVRPKFYASESVLTFVYVLEYLTRQAKRLKHLNFGHTLIDGIALKSLMGLGSKEHGMQLESLWLPSCDQLTNEGLRSLSLQPTLRDLDISLCQRVTDASLVCIANNLPNLEILDIRRCRGVTDLGIIRLNLLRKLRVLDISECDDITAAAINDGLCRNPLKDEKEITEEASDEKYINTRLEVLSVNALNIDERAIENIATTFPNLTYLDIGYCFSAVTDKSVQIIFKELTRLRTLNMSHCDKVSDAGFTGMGTLSQAERPDNESKITIKLVPNSLRIRLGSRAEEEIIQDANRKREVMELCEDTTRWRGYKTGVDDEVSTGFSLLRLRGIRKLDLSRCNRLTDVSLKHAFAFPELRELDVSICQQISHVGLDYLTKNNPAIEVLNLSMCHNITDEGILYVAERLHRLRSLSLQNCSRLTTESLRFIEKHCNHLKYLDIRFCQGMCVEGIGKKFADVHLRYTEGFDELGLPRPFLVDARPVRRPWSSIMNRR